MQLQQRIDGFDELIEEGDGDFQQSGLKKTSVARISRLWRDRSLRVELERSVLIGCSGFKGGSQNGLEETKETESLRHIQDEARYLAEARREVGWEEFAGDGTLKRAFVRSIEVICEATKNLSPELRNRYPGVNGERWLACAIG